MTKARALVVAMLTALLFVAGCQAGTTTTPKTKTNTGSKKQKPTSKSKEKLPPGTAKFVDPDGVFTVLYPVKWYVNGASSWAVEMSSMRSNTNLRSTRDLSVASVEIVVVPAPDKDDNAQMADKVVRGMLAKKPSAIRRPLRKMSIAGDRGAWIEVQMSAKTGDQIKLFVGVGGNDKRRVLILGYSPVGEWNKNLPIFKNLASSFKFTRSST